MIIWIEWGGKNPVGAYTRSAFHAFHNGKSICGYEPQPYETDSMIKTDKYNKINKCAKCIEQLRDAINN